MYKVYIYNIEEHKETDILTVSSEDELNKLKQVNYSFARDDNRPVLVTISRQFTNEEIIIRAFLCYKPNKNFFRKVYNVFANHTANLYLSNIFD